MQLQIVTPERTAIDIKVEELILPGVDGELDILPQHAALITALAPGELFWTSDGVKDSLVIGGGFADILADHITIVTDVALKASEIDENSIQEAVRAAQDALRGISSQEAEEAARIEANLAKSMAILKFKRKIRS